MRFSSREAFLKWTASHGIGPDPRFPASQTSNYLMFTHGHRYSRFWVYPKEVDDVPQFVDALISAVGSEAPYWLYPARGHWQSDPQTESWPQGRVWHGLLKGLGVPVDSVGAVAVDSTERATLLAMLFLQVTLGPAVYVDSVAIPEDGSAVLFFEHHHVVHAEFRDSQRLDATIDALASAGYLLPTELPDATFKPVEWMTKNK
jgi:hypothetical protein